MLVIHFDKEMTLPDNSFWSLTLYNGDNFKPTNSLSCMVKDHIDKLKFNSDGSLDIHIQQANPGAGKQENWLAAPAGQFFLVMRLCLPQELSTNGVTREMLNPTHSGVAV